MIVTISSCDSPENKGDPSFNGGSKLYHLWIKLLRQNGIKAFLVTWDSTVAPWLIDPQPAISLEEMKRQAEEIRPITGWLDSKAYLESIDFFYFCDCEIAYTTHKNLQPFYSRIRKVGNNNRYSYAWYSMAHPNLPKMLVPEWSDEDFWKPNSTVRKSNRVGYMAENDTDRDHVKIIQNLCPELEFLSISGNEQTVLNQMQTCDIFMGLNRGKDPVWGEGCPRTQQEAMHAGTVLVAYDVLGNREYLLDSYTGIIVPEKTPEAMAESLKKVTGNTIKKEHIRERSIDFASEMLSSKGKFEILRRFLDL